MQLTMNRAALEAALKRVSSSIGTRTSLPILSTVLLRADDDALTLQATNLEQGTTTRVALRLTEPGAIAVPYKLLASTIGSLKAHEVTLRLTSAGLTVTTPGATVTIKGCLPAEEFPVIPTIPEETVSLTLHRDILAALITRTTFAAATDDARPIFTGVVFTVKDGALEAAAADTFRLAIARFEGVLDESITLPPILLPATSLKAVKALLPDEGEVTLDIAASGKAAWVRTGDTTVAFTPIEGAFPNYQALIPSPERQAEAHHVAVAGSQLGQALGAIKPFLVANDAKTLHIQAGDLLELSATNDNQDSVTARLAAIIQPAPALEQQVLLSAPYLAEVLTVASTGDPTIHLTLISPQSPILVTLDDTPGFTYLVMPQYTRG